MPLAVQNANRKRQTANSKRQAGVCGLRLSGKREAKGL
jgi:hypothetical protein